MGSIILIAPQLYIIDEVINQLQHSGADYSKNIVIFPGRRPGHFLRKRLSEKLKSPYIPPYIFSIDDFIDTIFVDVLNLKGKKIEPIDAVSILYELHKNAENRIGGDEFLTPELFLPLGLKIFHDLEEMFMEEVSLEKLKAAESIFDNPVPELISKNLRSLSYFYDSFYELLDKKGLSTRASRYKAVLTGLNQVKDAGDCPSFFDLPLSEYKILYSGFYAFTELEKNIVKTLDHLSDLNLIVINGKEVKERIKHFRFDIIEKASEDRNPPEINIYTCPDTHAEVLTVATKLKELLDRGETPSTDTLIMLPSSEALFPLIHNCLGLVGEKGFNISMGYPLYRTPIYSFYINLMDLIESMSEENIYIEDYLRFILHPYVKNILFNKKEISELGENEITRILIHSIKTYFSTQSLKVFSSLEEIEEGNEIYELFFSQVPSDIDLTRDDLKEHLSWIHDNTIRYFSGFDSIKDFANRAKRILYFIYHHSTAKRHPYFYPFSESFIRAFEKLEGSLFSDYSFSMVSGYFNFFKNYIKHINVAFEGTPLRGIQVLGPLETRALKFSRIFILDVNEGIFPQTKREDSILPHPIREYLGLSTYKDREKIISYYFENSINAAREVHLICVENNQRQKSRFIERLIWQKQLNSKELDDSKFIKKIGYKVNLETIIPEPVPKDQKTIELLRSFTFTASSLDDYLNCGIRFYLGHILGLKSTITTERINLGIITHEILNRYFRDITRRPLSPELLSIDRMEKCVDEYFFNKYRKRMDGKTYLIRRQIKLRLNNLLENYLVPLSKKYSVIVKAVEKKIEGVVNGYKLKGIIDKIESRDRETFIVDYKTSYRNDNLKVMSEKLDINDKKTWKEAFRSIQIPFYIFLYNRLYDPETVPRGIYLLLGRAKIDRDIEFEPLSTDSYDIVEDFINVVLNEITDPDIDFQPPEDLKKTCPNCVYQRLCGTQWVKGSGYLQA